MKVIQYSQAPETRFENDMVNGVSGRVVIGKADGAANFCMRVFELDSGGFTPRRSVAKRQLGAGPGRQRGLYSGP
jgi:hypothetical protein